MIRLPRIEINYRPLPGILTRSKWAFAQLKHWRILRHYRGSPTTTGALVAAILVPQNH
ncbi:MAG: hypothetical protein ACRDPK_13720 [Carbonactinosporaceae bacterium]